MSGSKLLQLTLDDADFNPNAIYKAGETVHFTVRIQAYQPVECVYIVAKIYGTATVFWRKGRNRSYTSSERMIKTKSRVFTAPEGGQSCHPPGDYSYPVSFQLPEDIAASFKYSTLIKVSYHLLAKMRRSSHFNEAVEKEIFVVRDLDLNRVLPELTAPYESETPERTRVTCHALLNRGLGKAEIRFRLNKRGFCIGEQIQVTGQLRNSGYVDFPLVTMEIVQLCEFLANGRSRLRWCTVSIVRLPPLAAGRVVEVGHLLPVKAVNCSYLQGCNNIQVNYFFRIRAAGVLTILKKDLCELIIGSVPLGQQEPVDVPAWIPLSDEIKKK